MSRKLCLVFLVACSVWPATGAAHADDESKQAMTFTLAATEAKDAAIVLRAITMTKDLSIADDHTLVVRDTPENLELTAAVVKMVDSPEGSPDQAPLSVKDGSVVASVFLKHASGPVVLRALRKELNVPKIALLEDRLIFRDTKSKVDAELELVRKMEQAGD